MQYKKCEMVNTFIRRCCPIKDKKSKKKENVWKKVAKSKRLYIALLFLAAVVGGSWYVSGLRSDIKKEITSFDEEAWQEAVEKSGIEVVEAEAEEETRVSSDVLPQKEEEPVSVEVKPEPVVVDEDLTVEIVAEKDEPFSIKKPCNGKMIRECSVEELVYCAPVEEWRTHNGTDFAADVGDPVYAAADGVVAHIYEDEFMGLVLVMEHKNGMSTLYAGMQSDEFIKVGTAVKQGDVIGGVGKSGILESDMESHLHFEVQCNGEYENPMTYMKE